jgi:hypothetical protein
MRSGVNHQRCGTRTVAPIITYGHDHEQTGFFGFVGWGSGGFSPPAKNRFRKRRLPKNAKTCSAMGLQFYAPPGFDLSQIVRAGQNGGLLGINAAVGQGGTFDVQRETSILTSTTTFYSGYTQAANIAVGAYEYGAGLSPAGANFLANAYADVMFIKCGRSRAKDSLNK